MNAQMDLSLPVGEAGPELEALLAREEGLPGPSGGTRPVSRNSPGQTQDEQDEVAPSDAETGHLPGG